MSMDKQLILELLKIVVSLGSGAAILLIIILVFPNMYDKWKRIILEVLYWLSGSIAKLRQFIDRRLVAASIQEIVNGTCEKINYDCSEVMPHALKIQWVRSVTPEAFVKNGVVVVRLRNYLNQDRNLVEATCLFLKAGFLPRVKNFLDARLRQCCELKIAATIFATDRAGAALDYFVHNVLEPALSSDSELEKDMAMLDDMESVGFFLMSSYKNSITATTSFTGPPQVNLQKVNSEITLRSSIGLRRKPTQKTSP